MPLSPYFLHTRLHKTTQRGQTLLCTETKTREIDWWFEGDDSKFEENHVLFKDDEKYMEKLFGKIVKKLFIEWWHLDRPDREAMNVYTLDDAQCVEIMMEKILK